MRRICFTVAGLGNGGDHVKRNTYDLKELTVSKETETLGHTCKELDFVNNLNELGAAFFQSLPIRPQQADTLISAL